MSRTMRNVAISQQRDKKRYRLVHGGGLDRPEVTFKAGDYVLLKQQTSSTLDAPARPHILRVVEIKPSGVAVLNGSDVARIEEYMLNKLKALPTTPFPSKTTMLPKNASIRGHPCIVGNTEACEQDDAMR